MTPFNLFGIGGDTNPLLASDSEDIDTRSIFGQMGANKRRDAYDNSLLGMVHNWATSEQRQPVQLPDDASWLDQAKEAGLRMLNLPNDMAAGGAKTMAHWLGAAGNPEMVEPLDMLAPLGIGAMAGVAGAVPRGAVGSAGGKLAPTTGETLFADQSRSSLPGLLAGAVDEQPTGIRAFHGSPHDFDRFDMSKIGTGEGAQAYGRGLYFAENEGVARSYKEALAFKHAVDNSDMTNADHVLSKFVGTWGKDRERLIDALKSELGMQGSFGSKGRYTKWNDGMLPKFKIKSAVKDALRRVQSGEKIRDAMEYLGLGRMYEVRINANPDDFLDWDKPLSQQSEKLQRAVDAATEKSYGLHSQDKQRAYSDALREAGIPGIRYLDQGSRTAGEGSRNYVVFDDSLVDILRKYGLLGTLGGGSLLASSESEASPAGGLFGVP